jgi:amino acid adenylation domain-containing protein
MNKDKNDMNRLMIASRQKEKERDYWIKKLSGDLDKTHFAYDRKPKQMTGNPKPGSQSFSLSGEMFAGLMRLSKDSDHTLHMVLVSCLAILLNKYTGHRDVIIGTPVYQLEQENPEEMINTMLPIRSQIPLNDQHTFKDLLIQTREAIVQATENYSYPVEVLANELHLPSQVSENGTFPLFEMALFLQNIHDKEYLRKLKMSMIFCFNRTQDNLELQIEFDSHLYNSSTVKRIGEKFSDLLRKMLSGLEEPLESIQIMADIEKQRLLSELNQLEADYPREKTIDKIFEQQVDKGSSHLAVTLEDNQLTYGELNLRANFIAWYLKENGVERGTIVALLLDRSLEMVISIMGILKAGAVYLPLDPDSPMQRIVNILEDSYAPVLLTNSEVVKGYTFTAFQTSRIIKIKPCLTGIRPQITDFESIPIPNRSLVDYDDYNQYIGQASLKHCISIQATRGCPYKCLYCHKIWPKTHVYRSAEHIFDEVKLYYDMGVKRFALIDDIFNLNRKNSERFFELLIKNNIKIDLSFPNGVRGDILAKDYIDLMVEAGTREIALALETGSQRLQKLLQKNILLERLYDNCKYFCEKYPFVITRLYTMLGFPSETKEEAMMTMNFIKSMKWIHFPYLFILKVYPNTDMARMAMEHGVSEEDIAKSEGLAYHELPYTLPFEKSFALKYQADFFNSYFLSKERLKHVLPLQMGFYTEDEIVQQYDGYLPIDVRSLSDLLDFMDLSLDEMGVQHCVDESKVSAPNLNVKLREAFPKKKVEKDALKILFMDLSLLFSNRKENVFFSVIEPPLGLMYLLTYLDEKFGGKIDGKIVKSRIDFDNFEAFKELLEEVKPDVIGIRTLSYYRDFFHEAIAVIRQWGIDVPIIAGGPYPSSAYEAIAQDRNIDVVVMGEGEITMGELMEKILENGGKLPSEDVLKKIKGIAFTPPRNGSMSHYERQMILLDKMEFNPTGTTIPVLNQQRYPEDPAYIIYTSGTTGKPKGVMIEHQNVIRLMYNDHHPFDFSNKDVWTMFHSYSFDFSVWEMYGALLYGGKLVVVAELAAMNPEQFLNILEREKVTVSNQTPSAFFNFLDNVLTQEKKNLMLRYVIFGGEALAPFKLKEWSKRYPEVKLVNMFGITETTVHVTYKEIGQQEIQENISNIGKPIPTLSTCVLDEQLNLKVPGEPGELCVSGEGVGRGYLNRLELTDEKFIEDPNHEGQRMYRSGDLAKVTDSYEMEYIGRGDHQVKIRGYRIELGEIEHQLMTHPEIKEAIVITREDKETPYLCSYYVSTKEFTVTSLREHLLHQLPDYMIPSFFTKIEKIPLTPNGKVDKKALPDPDIKAGDEYIAPRNETEGDLVKIWSQILKIDGESIGIDSDFFELGGHSLNATAMISKVHKEFNVKLQMTEIFKTPSIRAISKLITQASPETFESIKPAKEKPYYELSSPQKRLYFLQQLDEKSTSYNISGAVELDFEPNREKLEQAFKQLIQRHESLRTSFEVKDGEPRQKISGEVPFSIDYYEAGAKEVNELLNQLVKPFNLGQAPLFRIALINVSNSTYLLMLDMHHIISDATSHQLFIKDFVSLYQGKELKPLKLQYKDFSEWRNSSIEQKRIATQEEFWAKEFEGDIPVLNLTTDFERPKKQSLAGANLGFNINGKNVAALREITQDQGGTMFMLMLSLFNILMSKVCIQEDIVVGTPIEGRTHDDLKQIIGMFVNTLALRNFPKGGINFTDFFREVKVRTLEAFNNQDYQYDDLITKVTGKRETGQLPLCTVGFIFQENLQEATSGAANTGIRSLDFENTASKTDLTFNVFVGKESISCSFDYCVDLFKRETIERYIRYFNEIVSNVTEDSEIKLKNIRISHELYDQKLEIPQDAEEEFKF